jgi:hypothetical protein
MPGDEQGREGGTPQKIWGYRQIQPLAQPQEHLPHLQQLSDEFQPVINPQSENEPRLQSLLLCKMSQNWQCWDKISADGMDSKSYGTSPLFFFCPKAINFT